MPRFLRTHGVAIAASALLVAFALSLCRRSISLSDEGYLLLQSLDMLDGKVLYRDMDAFVAPGIWFLVAGLFSFVEPSVLASRSLALAGLLATYGLGFRIVARVADRGHAWAAVAGLAVFTVWAFPAWTFTFYSPFAVLFALAALDRLLAWRETRRERSLLMAGLWLGLSVAFKQNYGAPSHSNARPGGKKALITCSTRTAEPSTRPATQASARRLKARQWMVTIGELPSPASTSSPERSLRPARSSRRERYRIDSGRSS